MRTPLIILASVLLLAGFGCKKTLEQQSPPATPTAGQQGVGGVIAPPPRPIGEPSRDVPILEASERAALAGAVATVDPGGSITVLPASVGDDDRPEELIAAYALADVAGGQGIGWVSIVSIDGRSVVTGAFSLVPPKENMSYVGKLVRRGAQPQVLNIGPITYDAATQQGSIVYTVGSADVTAHDAFVVMLESADGRGSVVLEGIRTTEF